MGVGLQVWTEFPRRWLGLRRASDDKVVEVAKALRTAAIEAFPIVEKISAIARIDAQTLLALHPAEEEVRIAFDGDRLVVTARTNGAGPGYHAFLVDLLDAVEKPLGIRWSAEGDETPYRAKRDFGALQAEMAKWLKTVAAQLGELEPDGCALLSMPMGTPIPERGAAMNPMGIFDADWITKTAKASDAELLARAAEFFPWWEKGPSPIVIQNAGRSILTTLPWHPPANDAERDSIGHALECLDAAKAAGAKGFEAEAEEARRHLAQKPEEATAPGEGFGYRRGQVRFEFVPGMSMVLPGYFYEPTAENPGYGFGDRFVFLQPARGDAPESAKDAVEAALAESESPVVESFAIPLPEDLDGYAVALKDPEAGEMAIEVHAIVTRPEGMLSATVTLASADQLPWAKSILASIRIAPPETEQEH